MLIIDFDKYRTRSLEDLVKELQEIKKQCSTINTEHIIGRVIESANQKITERRKK